METQKIKKLTVTALFMAMCCVSTMFLSVPSGGGYTNLGDAFVLLGAMLLGPWYGLAAGGIGSALADLLTGYAYYAPGIHGSNIPARHTMALLSLALDLGCPLDCKEIRPTNLKGNQP